VTESQPIVKIVARGVMSTRKALSGLGIRKLLMLPYQTGGETDRRDYRLISCRRTRALVTQILWRGLRMTATLLTVPEAQRALITLSSAQPRGVLRSPTALRAEPDNLRV